MSHLMFVDGSKFNIDAVVRAVDLGHQVTFVETDVSRAMYAGAAELIDRQEVVRLPVAGRIDSPAAAAAIQKVHRTQPIDGILTMLEQNVSGVAQLGQLLGIRSTSAQGVARAKDKGLARNALAKAGLATCRHVIAKGADALRAAAAGLRFPVIVKPVSGYGKLVTRRIENQQELDRFADEYALLRSDLNSIDQAIVSEEMIVEEYIEGPMFSVEIGVDERGTYPFMVTERRRPDHNPVIEIGSTMPTGASPEDRTDLATYAREVVRVLGLDLGIFHLEIILGRHGPVLVEANPRLMGGTLPLLYSRATDESIYDYLIQIHSGHAVTWQAGTAARYATVRQVAPVIGGVAHHDIDSAILIERCPFVSWSTVKVQKGQAILPMTCNVQSLGCFHVVADTYLESVERANAALDCAEALLGVQISR
jgi:biotin carboxylase